MATALNDLSNLEVVRGDTTKALETAKTSVDIARALSATDPSNKLWRILLADGLERSGNIRGGITTAWTQSLKLDSAQPTDQTGLDYMASLSDYEESREILRAMVAQDPTDTGIRGRLENILMRIGDLKLATKANSDALLAHKEALVISSELLSHDPGNTEWKRRVEVNYQKLQSVYAAQSETGAALTAAQKSLEIAQQLIDIDSGNLLWRHDLCARYGGLAPLSASRATALAPTITTVRRLHSAGRPHLAILPMSNHSSNWLAC